MYQLLSIYKMMDYPLHVKHKVIGFHLSMTLLFGCIYYFANLIDNHKKKYTFWHWLRFSLITQTTVGYCNIIPKSMHTQIINVMQLISIFFIIASL